MDPKILQNISAALAQSAPVGPSSTLLSGSVYGSNIDDPVEVIKKESDEDQFLFKELLSVNQSMLAALTAMSPDGTNDGPDGEGKEEDSFSFLNAAIMAAAAGAIAFSDEIAKAVESVKESIFGKDDAKPEEKATSAETDASVSGFNTTAEELQDTGFFGTLDTSLDDQGIKDNPGMVKGSNAPKIDMMDRLLGGLGFETKKDKEEKITQAQVQAVRDKADFEKNRSAESIQLQSTQDAINSLEALPTQERLKVQPQVDALYNQKSNLLEKIKSSDVTTPSTPKPAPSIAVPEPAPVITPKAQSTSEVTTQITGGEVITRTRKEPTLEETISEKERELEVTRGRLERGKAQIESRKGEVWIQRGLL